MDNLAPGISDLGIPDRFEEDKLVSDMLVPGSSCVSGADSLEVHNHAPGSDVSKDGLGDDIPVMCSFVVFEEDSLPAHTPVLCSFAVFEEDSLTAHTPVPGGSGMVEADKLVAHIMSSSLISFLWEIWTCSMISLGRLTRMTYYVEQIALAKHY